MYHPEDCLTLEDLDAIELEDLKDAAVDCLRKHGRMRVSKLTAVLGARRKSVDRMLVRYRRTIIREMTPTKYGIFPMLRLAAGLEHA